MFELLKQPVASRRSRQLINNNSVNDTMPVLGIGVVFTLKSCAFRIPLLSAGLPFDGLCKDCV